MVGPSLHVRHRILMTGCSAQKETLYDRYIPRYREITFQPFPTFSDISDHLVRDEMTFTRNERPDTELSNVDCAPSIRAQTIPNSPMPRLNCAREEKSRGKSNVSAPCVTEKSVIEVQSPRRQRVRLEGEFDRSQLDRGCTRSL